MGHGRGKRGQAGNTPRKQPPDSNSTSPLAPIGLSRSSTASSPNTSIHFSKKDSQESGPDFCLAIAQVESLFFPISGKELIIIFACVVGLNLMSAFMAVWGELSLVVHFYDRQGSTPIPRTFEVLEARERSWYIHRRVTQSDPYIVAFNSRRPAQLGRIIDFDEVSGIPKIVLVVEEDQWGASLLQNSTNAAGELSSSFADSRQQIPRAGYYELAKIRPELCPDQKTYGFDDGTLLQLAVEEANTLDQNYFIRWARYFASLDSGLAGSSFFDVENEDLYYERDVVLTICPGVTLQSNSKDPIFVNSHNLVIQCEGCVYSGRGSHFSFGRRARNVRFRGLSFRGAHTSSLIFYTNGAHVSFEDCSWLDNGAITRRYGAVADVNSSSLVSFSRCQIFNSQRGELPGLVTALSVRSSYEEPGALAGLPRKQ